MNIEERAISIYMNNMAYLESSHPHLHEKLKLFETAIEMGTYIPKYELQVVEDYFDIYDIKENKYFYNQNSYEYSKSKVNEINNKYNSNTFKTFYENHYDNKIIEALKDASITSNVVVGNAPISHYTQENSKDKYEMKNIYKCFVFGIGLGIHLEMLQEKLNAKKFLFIEPSLEIFRLSLFLTNYEKISIKSDIHFAIALNDKEFYNYIGLLSEETFLYDQYIKFFMFSQNCEMYINSIQSFLVSQRHILYSYDRAIESFQRTYSYLSENFKYIKLKNIESLNKPILLLAAGPSLSKNIDFIRKNKNKFIIVAVYAILPLLEKENIVPDIITQYDQQDKNVMRTLNNVKNIDFFKKSIFLFASHIINKLMDVFPKDRVFIFQALYKVKPDYKSVTAPSIGEITFGLLLHLGAKEIYFLGLDMAVSDSGKTHIETHDDAKGFGELKEYKNEEFTFRKSIIKIKGNFVDEVDTLPLFKVSISALNDMLQYVPIKDMKVYNLSDGAYFNNTMPLKIEDININEKESINKKEYREILINELNSISKNTLDSDEKEYNEQKIEDANKLFDEVRKFHSSKYSSIEIFKKSIFKLFNDLIYKECLCDDLQDIMLNFYKHNLPYIFHFFNLRDINNPKKHIKQLNKLLWNQTDKIFKDYLFALERVKNPKS